MFVAVEQNPGVAPVSASERHRQGVIHYMFNGDRETDRSALARSWALSQRQAGHFTQEGFCSNATKCEFYFCTR